MTPLELFLACKGAIERDVRDVVLVVPRFAPLRALRSRRPRVRLFDGPDRCPMGEILNEQMSPTGQAETVAAFDAIDVLAYMTARGLLEVDTRSPIERVRDAIAAVARSKAGA